MLCQEIELEEKIYDQGNFNYVFAAIDPKDRIDGFWIFSCSCYYNNTEITSIPRYNLNDRIWISEYECRRNFNRRVHEVSLCKHIKTCYVARLIVAQSQYNMHIPNWAKNYIGNDYYRKSMDIIRDLAPIPWGKDWKGRHGIGKVKLYDYTEYCVRLLKPIIGSKQWTCTCDMYTVWKSDCIHIYKVKLNEDRLRNRRDLCISLAIKYINE